VPLQFLTGDGSGIQGPSSRSRARLPNKFWAGLSMPAQDFWKR